MIRDFSESAKQKLLAYVKDVTETTVWGKLGDIIGDIGLQVQHWFGALDISKHVNNLDEYHKKKTKTIQHPKGLKKYLQT